MNLAKSIEFKKENMISLWKIAIASSVIAVSTFVMTPVQAANLTQVFNTSDNKFNSSNNNQGSWSATFPSSHGIYATGEAFFIGSNTPTGDLVRSFVTFDLSLLTGTVTSAKLQLQQYTSNGDSIETLGLFDVSTDVATLNNVTGTSTTIYNDLGTGTSYGTFPVHTGGNPSDILELQLNSDAISAINNASGKFFSIGLSLPVLDNGPILNETAKYLFAFNGGSSQQLVVETSATSVPEPSSAPSILALAVLAMGSYLKFQA